MGAALMSGGPDGIKVDIARVIDAIVAAGPGDLVRAVDEAGRLFSRLVKTKVVDDEMARDAIAKALDSRSANGPLRPRRVVKAVGTERFETVNAASLAGIDVP